MTEIHKLCPFDKKPCIGAHCAVWDENLSNCAFALTNRSMSPSPIKPKQKEPSVSSGLSGKYRDPLFG
jgi:hypothetical protein